MKHPRVEWGDLVYRFPLGLMYVDLCWDDIVVSDWRTVYSFPLGSLDLESLRIMLL
jgi:hypothetical protein